MIREIKRILAGIYIQPEEEVSSDALYSELAHKTNLLEILGQILQLEDESE